MMAAAAPTTSMLTGFESAFGGSGADALTATDGEDWGLHVLASMQPITPLTPEAFLARLPEAARRDLMESYPGRRIEDVAARILSRPVTAASSLDDPDTPTITDDPPYNDYYVPLNRGLMR